jgi:hypothetical protein
VTFITELFFLSFFLLSLQKAVFNTRSSRSFKGGRGEEGRGRLLATVKKIILK